MKKKNLLLDYLGKCTVVIIILVLLGNHAIAQNLLLNGDFESGISNWKLTNQSGAESTLTNEFNSDRGTNVGRISLTNAVALAKTKLTSDRISGIDNHATYVIRGWVKGPAGADFKVQAKFNTGGSSTQYYNIVYKLTGEWQLIGAPHIKKGATYTDLDVVLQLGAVAGDYYLDDFEVTKATEFLNLGFEDGSQYLWKHVVDGSTTISETNDASEGTKASRITVAADGEQGRILTDIQKPVEPGATYEITVSVKGANGAENDSISISGRGYDVDNNAAGEIAERFLIIGNYQDYTYTYIPGESVKYFGLKVVSGDVAGDYYVDNIRVNKIEGNPTSVEESQLSGVKVFPNPTAGELQISNLADGSVITLYSQTGRKIISQESTSSFESIDLSSYSNGIYFVEVKDGSDVKTMKVVKVD